MGLFNAGFTRVFGAIIVASLLLDAVWLTLRSDFHSRLIKSIQSTPVHLRPVPALIVYIIIALALAYFVVTPATSQKEAIRNGALLGAALYGVYDFTNYASFRRWTFEMVFTDTLWGAVMCAGAAAAGFYVKNR